jgi:hypothetical protein
MARFYVEDDSLEVEWQEEVTEENALDLSIQKWERMDSVANGKIHAGGMATCALCSLYNRLTFCKDTCPIKRRTGQDGCDGAPHKEFPTKEQAREMKEFLIGLQTEDKKKVEGKEELPELELDVYTTLRMNKDRKTWSDCYIAVEARGKHFTFLSDKEMETLIAWWGENK